MQPVSTFEMCIRWTWQDLPWVLQCADGHRETPRTLFKKRPYVHIEIAEASLRPEGVGADFISLKESLKRFP